MRLVQLAREEGRGFAAVQRIADQLDYGVESVRVAVLNEYVRLTGYAHDDRGSTPNLAWLSDWLAQTPMGPLDKRHGSADRELIALIALA